MFIHRAREGAPDGDRRNGADMQEAFQGSIVIVEDEPAHAEAMRRTLGVALPAASVQVARTLRRYREIVGQSPPMIALVDMNLPDGRAVEVLTSPAENAPFPVVVMTSYGDQKMAVDCMRAGAIDYFAKSEQSFLACPRIIDRAMRQWMLLQERKLSQELLKASEERHRALFENSNDAILLIENGRCIDCNPAATRLLGATREQVLAADPADFSPAVQPDGQPSAETWAWLMRAALVDVVQPFDWHCRRADGSSFTAEVSLNRVEVQSRTLLQAIVRDITERRQFAERMAEKNQQLEKALSVRDRFLAMISHELRTPLNAIIGLAGLMAMKLAGPLTDVQEQHLEGLRSSALHLLGIINELLDLSRLESGRVEPNFDWVPPLEVVREVMDAMRPMAVEKGLVFRLADCEDCTPIRTDRRMLKQILFNLVSNGVKYTDSGFVAVSVVDDGEKSCFRVADSGPGIPEDRWHLLFQEFGRVGDDPSKDGTGLGLYLCRKLADLIGAQVRFESAAAAGSVFSLVVERRVVEAREVDLRAQGVAREGSGHPRRESVR